jgi:hypothetical protein
MFHHRVQNLLVADVRAVETESFRNVFLGAQPLPWRDAGTIDQLPDKALPERRKFEQSPQPNLTGTMAAYRPGGSLASKGIRPASTGDYEAWKPDQA